MKEEIQRIIKDFVTEFKIKNRSVTDWDSPIVAFADAHDPLFFQLRSVVAQDHILPWELLKEAKTVICYFIPFKKDVVLSNEGGRYCSEQWAIAYIETNRLIHELNGQISKQLEASGFRSVSLPPTHNFDQDRLVSNWSHKHVAYIAGLGRFGLHHMLITEKGCCGRLGSLVTNVEIEPTNRPKEEFCLYKRNKSCKKCVENCISGALKANSLDKKRCYEVCLSNARLHSKSGFADVCGKCICVVPCSFVNPL